MQINHTSDKFNQKGFYYSPDSSSSAPTVTRRSEEQRNLLRRLALGDISNQNSDGLVLGWEQSTIAKFGRVAGEIEKPENYNEPGQCLNFLQTKANDDMLAIINNGLDTCLKLQIPATHYISALSVIDGNRRLTGKNEFSKASDSLLTALQEYPLDKYYLSELGHYVREALELGYSKERVSEHVKKHMQSQTRDVALT